METQATTPLSMKETKKAVGVSPEQFFHQLKELDVRYNRIDSRRLVRLQLQKLQLLSFVDVSNNRLQNLDGLKNLRNLRKIRADEPV